MTDYSFMGPWEQAAGVGTEQRACSALQQHSYFSSPHLIAELAQNSILSLLSCQIEDFAKEDKVIHSDPWGKRPRRSVQMDGLLTMLCVCSLRNDVRPDSVFRRPY
ncbi:hypothetical protein INR49_009718 [Caranx melampygus]|nr:hypothetical protein INR49_009718 [Caranx melampygus]